MKIDYIKLKNYRQFKDSKIDFINPDKEKNFIIIEGANGEGKSNILNAITWCLYSKEIHLKESTKGLPMLNTITLNELKTGQMVNVEVDIQMTDEEKNDTYRFVRKATYQKLSGGRIERIPHAKSQEPDSSEFKVYKLKRNDWDEQYHPSTCVSRFMPEDIMEYFFFDGERLNEYFKEPSGEKIKEAIFDISKLDLLERVINHLESIKREFLRTEKHLPPKVEQIQEGIDKCDERIEWLTREIKEKQALIKKVEDDKRTISKKLKEYSPKLVRELASNREKATEELNQLETKIEKGYQERNQYMVEVAPIIYASQAIIQTKELINKSKDAGEIPPKYRKSFIQKLLRTNKCICGTNLSTCKECRKRIEKLLSECMDISDISGEIIDLGIKSETNLEEIKDFNEQRIKYSRSIKELENRRKETMEKIEEINRKLKGISDKDIKETETYYQELESALKDENINLGELRRELNDKNDRKKELVKDLEKELKKEEKLREIGNKLIFCSRSADIAKKIKDEIMQEVREKIEEKTQQQFSELHWKKEVLKISIDSEYNISVKDRFDMEQIDTFSAGERQLLALSFMAALNSVSGFKAPIVIDTPLGRFSKEPKENVAENLPNYLKGCQVTLLVTDEDYTPSVRERLLPRAAKEYKINFEETPKGNQAEIESYE